MGLEAGYEAYLEWAKEPSSLEDALDTKRLINHRAMQGLTRDSHRGKREAEQLLQRLTADLMQLDLLQGCIAASYCGALIEAIGVNGTGNAIVDLFAHAVRLSCEFLADVQDSLGLPDDEFDRDAVGTADLQAVFRNNPDRVRAYFGCDLLALAVMAVITRDAPSRFYLRTLGIEPHLQYLQHYLGNLQYVVTAYSSCSEMEAVVLAPSVRQGVRIVANDLSNCFHLMTLLEAELSRKGWANRFGLWDYKLDREIYAVASGETYPKRNFSVMAHQQYYTVHALQPDGEYVIQDKQSGKLLPETLIWGEMPPEAIPPLPDGTRIILMDSKGMMRGRSWDAGFICKCHDALNPYVRITEALSTDAYTSLMKKLMQERSATADG